MTTTSHDGRPRASAGGLVTLGETMVLLSAPPACRLRHVTSLAVGIGGAESNVAIGVRRLGGASAWIGRVGDDELGELVVGRIAAEGVDIGGAVSDPDVPTSLMIKERRTSALSAVTYYRAGGPGSRLHPDDLDSDRIAAAGVLHLTGITPALSDSACDTVRAAIETARAAGVLVSLDINYRAALWEESTAQKVLTDLVRRCDIVFAGDDEATMLGLSGSPESLAASLSELGPSQAVIKLGSRGAVAHLDGARHTVSALPVDAVDPVGAGDAFVAGYLTELLDGEPPSTRLATAAACGAFAVTSHGDWEGLPTRADLKLLGVTEGTVLR